VEWYVIKDFTGSNVACVKSVSKQLCEISGSHGGEYKDGCILGCYAMFTDVSEVLAASIIRAMNCRQQAPLKRL
jgi:hypothetical protein